MGLKYMKNLKYLRLEGLDAKVIHFIASSHHFLLQNIGKAALLLEDTIPRLTVLGVDYEEQMKLLEAETRLLENPNVVQDAKGWSCHENKADERIQETSSPRTTMEGCSTLEGTSMSVRLSVTMINR